MFGLWRDARPVSPGLEHAAGPVLEIFGGRPIMSSCRFTSFIAPNASGIVRCSCAPAIGRERSVRIADQRGWRRSFPPLPPTVPVPVNPPPVGWGTEAVVAAVARAPADGHIRTEPPSVLTYCAYGCWLRTGLLRRPRCRRFER